MKIDVKVIKELAKDFEKYGLEEITLESEGTKISLKKEKEVEKEIVTQVVEQPRVVAIPSKKVAKSKESKVEAPHYESVKSPMVGTYYGSPSPDADSFVKEGETVRAGDTLCIVEAMKLMNEVKAEKDCRIVKLLLKDGDPVTKGIDLFLIEEV